MKPRLRAEELTGMISLLRDKFVRSENQIRKRIFNKICDDLKKKTNKFIEAQFVKEFRNRVKMTLFIFSRNDVMNVRKGWLDVRECVGK